MAALEIKLGHYRAAAANAPQPPLPATLGLIDTPAAPTYLSPVAVRFESALPIIVLRSSCSAP
jgi:hypothetical protein